MVILKKTLILVGFSLLSLFFACLSPNEELYRKKKDYSREIYLIEGLSETLSVILPDTLDYIGKVALLGKAPNDVKVYGNQIFVVNSLSNSITIYDEDTASLLDTINLPTLTNPWMMELYSKKQYILVTSFLQSKLLVIDFFSRNVLKQISTMQSPEGFTVFGDRVYIADTGYKNGNFGDAYITVVSLDSLTKIRDIYLPCKNPQFVFASSYTNKVYAICTGNYEDVAGKIVVISPNTLSVLNVVDVGGYIGGYVYLEDKHLLGLIGVGKNVLFWSLDTENIFSSYKVVDDDKIFLSGIAYDNLYKRLFIASFNEDKVYVYDVSDIEDIKLIKEIYTLDGPQTMFLSTE